MARSIKSVLAGGEDRADDILKEILPQFADNFPDKLWWFSQHGYVPHAYQAAFHGADTNGKLTRFRHLVAGRRGGKTMSAAWEILYYLLHPEAYHKHLHGTVDDRPLWAWCLTKDHPTGFAAWRTFSDVMHMAGLVKDKDYQRNLQERRLEFTNGSMIQFRTAVDPQSLRGAGLDALWVDEAAFIESPEFWDVVRPALADKRGMVLTTTTPMGRNWLYDLWFSGDALEDQNQFRVEYTSIDSPYFSSEEFKYAQQTTHPAIFKREYLASFDSMQGQSLHGDWLHYYVSGEAEGDDISIAPYRSDNGELRLRKYIGIDPAISLSDTADYFAWVVIGVAEDNSHVFVLESGKDRISFPDQLLKIQQLHLRWKPELIGIEGVAYQRALAQQAARMEGMPPITAIMSKGKKSDRILAMSPMFRIGKVRIRRSDLDLIEEWLSYDDGKRNQRDDLLDAMEIALGTAGVILPVLAPDTTPTWLEGFGELKDTSLEASAQRHLERLRNKGKEGGVWIPSLGSEA